MAKTPTSEDAELIILPIQQGTVSFCVLGRSPLIFNRMSEKAKRELLMPRGKKTAADKAANLKHEPVQEYRASVYRRANNGPTRLVIPSAMFKGAMMTAALDLPGTKKTEIGRLVWVDGTFCDVYGVPQLLMSVVRSADMNRTPDIRTRAIVPEWACRLTVSFVQPKMTVRGVANLLAAGGILSGVGDFRQEKGKGNFGQFEIVDEADERFQKIIRSGVRAGQDAALNRHKCYDIETEELLEWYESEILRRRGRKSEKRSRSVMPMAAE